MEKVCALNVECCLSFLAVAGAALAVICAVLGKCCQGSRLLERKDRLE